MEKIEVFEAEHIGKRYGGNIALSDISCKFEQGTIYGLVGENGAGKSTLVKILNGTVLPDKGRLMINGRQVEFASPSMAARQGVGMVYQEMNLIPNLSIMENVFISQLTKSNVGYIDWKTIKRKTQEYLDIFQVDLKPTELVGELKAAHQQIVAIIRAYAMNGSMIILDEPTSALPLHEIHILLDVVKRLKELGCIVIYISHKLQEILTTVDRVIALRDGVLVGTFDTAEFTKDTLAELIAGKKLKQKFPKQEFVRKEELLRLEHVSVKGALEDISFSLHKGEILGFAGLLGAGKTEVAKTIFGLYGKSYTGDIYLRGKKIKVHSPMAAIREKIGLVPENRGMEGLIHNESVKDNASIVAMPKYSVGGFIKNGAVTRLVQSLMKSLNVKCASILNNILSLSGGNQQKVVLAKWIAAETELIMFDEPTRGIDVGAKYEIYLLMNQLVEQGVGVMIMSSENDELMNMCDRVVILKEGRIVDIIETKDHEEEDLEDMLA